MEEFYKFINIFLLVEKYFSMIEIIVKVFVSFLMIYFVLIFYFFIFMKNELIILKYYII